MAQKNKPKIGQWVYKIYCNCITKMKVYMLGTNEFCTEDAFDELFIIDARMPLDYADYGEIWFYSLQEAKEKIKEKYPDYKIVKLDELNWEAMPKE